MSVFSALDHQYLCVVRMLTTTNRGSARSISAAMLCNVNFLSSPIWLIMCLVGRWTLLNQSIS